MIDFEQMLRDPVSRRAFLARMSAAGLGALSLPLLTGCNGNTSSNNTNSAVGNSLGFPGIPGRNANEVVLNYALTLEITEADLYRQALNRAAGLALGTQLDTESARPARPAATRWYWPPAAWTAIRRQQAFYTWCSSRMWRPRTAICCLRC